MPAEAVLSTLKHVWNTLKPLELPMAVMGGIALAAWEHVRATRDVDLLIALGCAELDTVLDRLADAGVRAKRQPPVLDVGDISIVQLLYSPPESFVDLQVDLMLARSTYHRTALDRRTTITWPELGMDIDVLSCEDLIVHKLLAGRVIDRADVAALLRGNRQKLDLAYLTHWTKDQGLTAELATLWEEAFPGEPPLRELLSDNGEEASPDTEHGT